ncbi:RelA/SpoT domain-containing protein [uncultured Desulfovibrio sp.]|uniref:RelA/SpoT domain-containing protein n=1 Tax=uncultured Desulfovibrio sp. TaxID=167968 RepID=UPI0026022A2A|nr:RelA/SpoT domain-containing protein [uncultured Desulfovibrio sp.]
MPVSKSKVDKSGYILSESIKVDEYIYLEFEEYFDEYRKEHLPVLTSTTLEIQDWLSTFSKGYYIAQRLKRKPQIIRKLKRLSVRLTQLQDIGGLRIIVDTNKDVNELLSFLKNKVDQSEHIQIHRITDYREHGRDTGYRALHVILSVDRYKLELQIRSKIQHYWAESIERTSIVYGYYLKESEGSNIVLDYFQNLAKIFNEIEAGRKPAPAHKIALDKARDSAIKVIESSDKKSILNAHVDEGVIKTLVEKESKNRNQDRFNNWILILDWNTGCFVDWKVISRNPDEAIRAYVETEKLYPNNDGFEVVMIGSSDISTVRETHSLDDSIVSLSKRMDLDTGARDILLCMVGKKYWSKKISIDTLKNHYCRNVLTFEHSLQSLIDKGYIIKHSQGPVSLNIAKKNEIESCL